MLIDKRTLFNENEVFNTFGALIDSHETNGLISYIYKKTFSDYLRSIMEEINTSKTKTHYYSLQLYNSALIKIIDLVGEKQYFLKDPKVCSDEKIKAEALILELDEYYTIFFDKYLRLQSGLTIQCFLENEFYSNLPFSYTFKLLKPYEIQQKKALAGIGYSVMEELDNWFKDSPKDALLLEDLIQAQVNNFLKWADAHPRSASYLAADIALTCSILLEKNAVDKFVNTIKAKNFTRLFLDALGLSPEHEKVEEQELLKFRALADFIKHCPKMASGYLLVKKTASGEFKNITDFVMGAIKETGINFSVQKAVRIIPEECLSLVTLVVEVLRGEEMHNIIAHQRNLKLVQMAGGIRALLNNKVNLLIDFEIYWKTVFKAKNEERKKRFFTQIILPFFGIALFILGLILHVNPLYNIHKLLPYMVISGSLIWLSRILTFMIDESTGFKLKNAVQNKVYAREKQKELSFAYYFLSTDPHKEKQIQQEAKIYIADLQKRYCLSVIPKDNKALRSDLSPESLTTLESLQIKYVNALNWTYDSTHLITIPKIVALFNQIVDLKKLRIKLKGYDEKVIDTIVFSLTDDLIDNWLTTHLEHAFKEKFLELYLSGDLPENSTTPKKYLKTHLSQHKELKDNPFMMKILTAN